MGRERRGPGRLHGKSVSCPTGLILLKGVYIRHSMSSQSPRSIDIETDEDEPPVTHKQIVEWFRALPPGETIDFFMTLPLKNQEQIRNWARTSARRWANDHTKTKANLWRMVQTPEGRKYWQNYQTKETHWARTAGSGALDTSTGTYHVPLD